MEAHLGGADHRIDGLMQHRTVDRVGLRGKGRSGNEGEACLRDESVNLWIGFQRGVHDVQCVVPGRDTAVLDYEVELSEPRSVLADLGDQGSGGGDDAASGFLVHV